MNRKLNLKLLVLLAVGSIVFVVTVYLVHEYQVKRNSAGLLARAEKARADGKYEEAVKMLTRYMEYREHDYAQHANLALAHKDYVENTDAPIPDIQRAYRAINVAIQRLGEDPEKYEEQFVQLRRAAAEFALKYGLLTDASDHLQYLIDKFGAKAESDAAVDLARCNFAKGQAPEAKDLLAKLVGYDHPTRSFSAEAALAPDKIDAYAMLAFIYRDYETDKKTAGAILEQMIVANPDSHEAYLKRCQYWRGDGEESKELARADIEKALELGPDQADVVVTALEMKIEDGSLDEAKQRLDQAVEQFPDDTRFYRLLAFWATKKLDFAQAKRFVQEGLKRDPDDVDLVWYRANLELEINEIEEAKISTQELEDMSAPREYIEVMKAQIHMAEAEWIRAREIFEEIQPVVNRTGSILRSSVDRGLARCYERLNQPDKQLEHYQNLEQGNEDDQKLVWGLINSMLAAGKVRAAIERYERLESDVKRQGDELEPRFQSTRLRLEIARQLMLPESNRDWQEADRLMAMVKASDAMTDRDKVTLWAYLLQQKGNSDDADRLLALALDKFPDDLALHLHEVEKVYERDGVEAALAKLDSVQRQLGDSVDVRATRARLFLRQGGNVGPRLLELEKNVDAFDTSQRVRLWKSLAMFHYTLPGDGAVNARRLFEQAIAEQPGDVNTRMILFEIAKELNEPRQVDQELSKLRELVGRDGPEYMVSEASRILWNVRRGMESNVSLDRAKSLVNDVRNVRPDWERLDRIQAEIHVLENNLESAVDLLRSSVSRGRATSAVKSYLFRLLVKMERLDEARAFLDQFPEAERLPEDRQLANALLSGGNISNLNYNSANPDDHLLDGQMLAAQQRWDEAEAAFLRAVRTGPTRNDTWLRLVAFLTSRGKLIEAEEVIREAQLQLPEYLVPLVCGQCYEYLGDRAQALQFYTRAHNVDPQDTLALRALASFHMSSGDLTKTSHYLNAIIDVAASRGANEDAQASWARRQFARLEARQGGYDSFLRALKRVEENQTDSVMSPQDLLLWVELAANRGLRIGRGDPVWRARAIVKLEEAAKKRELSEDERLALAQLYEQTNQNWDRCREIVESILASRTGAARNQLLGIWVSWLLERDMYAEVEAVLTDLDPNSSAAKQVRARLLARQGQSKEVRQILRSILSEVTPENNRALLEIARFTEELSKHDPSLARETRALYQRYAQKEPIGKLALAEYLARSGQLRDLQQAFDLCEQIKSDKTIELVVQSAMNIAREQMAVISASSDEYQKLEGWIRAANQQKPDSRLLALRLAALEEIRGNSEAAEAHYREVLGRNDVDATNRAIVSNNLAFLLALQGKGSEAEKYIQAAMEQLGPLEDVLDTRAVVQLSQDRPDEAKKDLVQVTSGGSNTPEVFFHLARAEHMLNNTTAAREALTKAVELGLSERRLKPIERPMLKELSRQLGFNLGQASRLSSQKTR